MALIPLAWLTTLQSGGRRIARMWWLIAAGFLCSWIADWFAHHFGAYAIGPLYLVPQAALIVWALAARETAVRFCLVLGATSAFALLQLDLTQPDVLVHCVAWGGMLALIWPLPLVRSLRWALGMAFGVGGLVWLGFVVRPGWASWLTYQSVRAVSLGLFCRAAWKAA